MDNRIKSGNENYNPTKICWLYRRVGSSPTMPTITSYNSTSLEYMVYNREVAGANPARRTMFVGS